MKTLKIMDSVQNVECVLVMSRMKTSSGYVVTNATCGFVLIATTLPLMRSSRSMVCCSEEHPLRKPEFCLSDTLPHNTNLSIW